MLILPLNNPYALLAAFLSPCKGAEHIDALRQLIVEERVNWPELVYLANLQLCTPLWYVQLQRDGLLELLPTDLQDYLNQLYQANVERNAEMRHGLEELLHVFAQQGITALLLKGAASFCDDLYADSGARIMGDLDILVDPQQVDSFRTILLELGYQEIPDPGMEFEGLATDERHHQLPRFFKPGTPVVVEVHFKVSYGQSGRVLPAESAWNNSLSSSLGELETHILNPTWRVLHNTVHGLLPHCEFIRGDLSLLQLVEFTTLAQRYAEQLDWSCWRTVAGQNKLETEFDVYLLLAKNLLFLPDDAVNKPGAAVKWHLQRILATGKRLGAKNQSRSLVSTLYYYLNLPVWVWRNVCYIEGARHIPTRLAYLLKKGMSARSRAKIKL